MVHTSEILESQLARVAFWGHGDRGQRPSTTQEEEEEEHSQPDPPSWSSQFTSREAGDHKNDKHARSIELSMTFRSKTISGRRNIFL